MEKYQLSHLDAIYLLLIKAGISHDRAIDKLAQYRNVLFEPDLSFYLNNSVIVEDESNSISSSLNAETKAKVIFDNMDYIQRQNFLSAPIELTIYPSLNCQFDCEFCFVKNMKNMRTEEHNANDWMSLVKSFIDAGVSSVSILGGEPSLYYDIIPLIKGINELGIRFTMTTNAQNWSDELIETAILANNLTPIVSLEAINHGLNSKTYEARYKAENALELVKNFRDRGKSCRINTVYYGQTREELEILVDFCGENQVEKFSLALYNGPSSHDNLIAETNEMGGMLIKHAQIHGYQSLNIAVEGCMIYSSYLDFDGAIVKTDFQRLQYGCECGNTILEILPDGGMIPCAALLSYSDSFGNAFEGDWRYFWFNSEVLNWYRNYKCIDPTCMQCSSYHFCNGGCPAYYLHMDGNKSNKRFDSRCKIHHKLLN